MEINIGSYKLRVEILALIVLVFFVMFGTTLFGCSNVEGLEGIQKQVIDRFETKKNVKNNNMGGKLAPDAYDDEYESSLVTTDTVSTATTEGFVNANNAAFGPEFSGSQSPGYILPPNTWSMPTLEYSKGTTPTPGVESILERTPQPIPVPEGRLDFLGTTPFKPECCPGAYSGSTGCACLTMDQYKYLHERGGNNVPYSEY